MMEYNLFRSKDLNKDLNKRRGELGKTKLTENFVDKQQLEAVSKQIAKLEVCSHLLLNF